ncbi:hypothetical protein H1C71_038892, partial [Ictidomys tridecemlineatus]
MAVIKGEKCPGLKVVICAQPANSQKKTAPGAVSHWGSWILEPWGNLAAPAHLPGHALAPLSLHLGEVRKGREWGYLSLRVCVRMHSCVRTSGWVRQDCLV